MGRRSAVAGPTRRQHSRRTADPDHLGPLTKRPSNGSMTGLCRPGCRTIGKESRSNWCELMWRSGSRPTLPMRSTPRCDWRLKESPWCSSQPASLRRTSCAMKYRSWCGTPRSPRGGAATWDLKLAYEYGELIGRELRDQLYNASLGGGVNLMREPRNGRNFEYMGEDPILAGKMLAEWVRGMQSQKVISDVKHYAFNDQENGRSSYNVKMDKRTMRETDLLAFEIAITEGQPGMVMCSYNKLNGDYACENSYLLNDLLKKTWGFKGFVVSDWGATHSTAKAVLNGLDNEQPAVK